MSTLSTALSSLRLIPLALVSTLALIPACDTQDGDDYAARVAQIEEAQDLTQVFHAENDQCVEAFHACAAAREGEVDCRAALESCAPEEGMMGGLDEEPPSRPPPHCRPPGGEGELDGDRPPPPDGGEVDGDRPPPPEDGQLDGDRPPPPEDGQLDGDRPPPPEDGERPEGEGECQMHGGLECMPLKHLAHEAIKGCRDEMQACMEEGLQDEEGCVLQTRECVVESLGELFAKLCEVHLEACAVEGAPADKCEQLATYCEEGVLPPELTLPEPPAPGDAP